MKTVPAVNARTHEHRGAAALRIDHFQLAVPDVPSALAFYTDCGCRVSGFSCIGDRIVGALLHRKDNPHDVVLQEGTGPRLQHVGFIVQETHHLMRALDAAEHYGFAAAIEHGPRRNGHSHRLYLRDPDGHRVALQLPPIQVIDGENQPERHEIQMAKGVGGAPPHTWFEEATNFAGVPVSAPKFKRGFEDAGSRYVADYNRAADSKM